MQFVDEQHDRASGRFDFTKHGLQSFFEFASKLRAGDQRAHVQRDNAFVLQALRNIALDDPQRQALRQSPSFPTPGSPINTGLFLVRREST